MKSNGGISSLDGFAYQIKVFVYYLEQLQENMEIGYETYEDVAINYNQKIKTILIKNVKILIVYIKQNMELPLFK